MARRPLGPPRDVHPRAVHALTAFALLTAGGCADAPLALALPLDGPLAVYLRLAAGDTVVDARVSMDPRVPERFPLDGDTRAIVVAWWPADVALPEAAELELTRTPALLANPTCDGESIAPDGRRRLPLSAMPRAVRIDAAAPETATPIDPAQDDVLAGRFLAIDRREERCRTLADETLRPFAQAFDAIPPGTRLANGVVEVDSQREADDALERELELRTLLPLGDDAVIGVSLGSAMIFRRGRPFAPTPDSYAPITDATRSVRSQGVAGAALRFSRTATEAELLVASRVADNTSAIDRLAIRLEGPGAPAFVRAQRTWYPRREAWAIMVDHRGAILLGHGSGVDRVRGAELEPLPVPQTRVGALLALPNGDAPHVLVTYAGVVHVGDLETGAFRSVEDLRVNAETSIDMRRATLLPNPQGTIIAAVAGTSGRLYTLRGDASRYTVANVDLPAPYAPCTLPRGVCGHVRYAGELNVLELSDDGELMLVGDGRCNALTVVRARDLCARTISATSGALDWPVRLAFTSSVRVGRRVILGGRGGRLAELDLTPR